jgi:hypothetical protein
MPWVTFVVVLICSLVAAVMSMYALRQLYHKNRKSRGTYAMGFGFWLLGIVLASILFGFFTV